MFGQKIGRFGIFSVSDNGVQQIADGGHNYYSQEMAAIRAFHLLETGQERFALVIREIEEVSTQVDSSSH